MIASRTDGQVRPRMVEEQLRLLLQIQRQLQDLGALSAQVERIEDLVQRRTAPRDVS